MKKALYREIAGVAQARDNCIKSGNHTWKTKHACRLVDIEREHLPSGSGFDNGTTIESATDQRIVFRTSFHHMNEGGYYDGWTEHSVIVTPSLSSGFCIRVTGRNRNDIKDYIAELFDGVLREEVES